MTNLDISNMDYNDLIDLVDGDGYTVVSDDSLLDTPAKTPTPPTGVILSAEIPDEETVTPVKHRGRPKKEKVESVEALVAEIKEPSEKTEKKRGRPKKSDSDVKLSKKIQIDELPQEIITEVFNLYSTAEIKEITRKTGLPRAYIGKIMDKLTYLFTNAVANGTISNEKYELYIEPKLKQYNPSADGQFSAVVIEAIQNINN